ncbi:MAG TPA: energy-coupling factor transporter transmembrane component T [Bryobacteraceae bacterium]|jgi:cobalt/nickel transport system permease protein
MHHVLLERWSRAISPVHQRDARIKLLAALIFLIVVATTPPLAWRCFVTYAAVLIAATLIARLPIAAVLSRAALVVPFCIVFGITTWVLGDHARALGLLEKAFLSAWTALWLAATTPLPRLLKAAEWYGVPRLLILVIQFLYRYLFVLSEQAQHMRHAAACRAGSQGAARSLFRAAAGALAVLFARSYQRADGIYRAMQSRGFTGSFPAVALGRLTVADAAFLLLAVVPVIAVRFL